MIFHMTLHRPMRSLARSFARTLTLLVAFVGSNVANAAPAAPAAPPAPLEPPSPPAPLAPPEAPTVGPPAPLVPPAHPTSAPVKAAPHAAPVQVPMPAAASAPSAQPGTAEPPKTTETAPPLGAQVDDKDPRALDQFQTQLDPYGAWADDPKFGHVWVPARSVVGENFSPYVTAGHWALDTDDNYVWVSDYPFGNVVFHYGRWAWTSYGWSWIPGYQYAPAWVSWRVPTAEYAYVGWAPLAPGFVWMGGVAVSLWYPSPYYWVFCPSMYLFAPYPYHHIVTYPPYVQSVGAYTRNYVPASPTIGPPKGPPMALAKVPPTAIPSHRMVSGPGNGNVMSNTLPRTMTAHGMSSPRVVSSAPAVRPPPNTGAAPSVAGRARMYGSSPPPVVSGPPRAVTSAAFSSPTYRGYNQGFSSPRTYSPSAGVYSPASTSRTYSPSSAPRVYSPSSSPVYSPASSSRTYSPSYAPRVYSPSSSPVYSPSSAPRVYSPSSVSPRVYSPASSSPRMYSPSHTYSPSGGGAHMYGGGGHHR